MEKNENTQNDTNIYLKLIDKDRRGKRKQKSLAIFLNLLRFFSVAESLPIFSWDKIRSEIEPYSYIRRESM